VAEPDVVVASLYEFLDCSDCPDCYDCSGCSGCSDCYDCYDCSDCSGCSGCYDCYDCSGCSDCSGCYGKTGNKNPSPIIPAIDNIHQRILDAVSKPEALDMSAWHTCETTHCRAGWVVTLAGKEGTELEAKTSTCHAAMQIYKASSPIRVSPVRFFETDALAMEDIKRCAKEEAANT